MNATDKLMDLDKSKSIVPITYGINHGDNQFSHSDLQHLNDPTGIAIEEGELLYGLIRTVKPRLVLETGTNVGVSAQYIAVGLKDNGVGHLTTIEHDSTVAAKAREKLTAMNLDQYVTVLNTKTDAFFADLKPEDKFDFLWLDTELNQRYNELLTLWPHVVPGGIICIHDLWHLDFDWFGGVPEGMKKLIREGDLRGMTFKTDHGVTVLQKRRESDYFADLLKAA